MPNLNDKKKRLTTGIPFEMADVTRITIKVTDPYL